MTVSNAPARSIHIDYSKSITAYHRKAAELAVKYAPANGKLIDIGCGTGIVLQLIHNARPDIALSGADIDDQCLRITVERAPGVTPIKLSQGEMIITAANQGYYDVCLMSHVLEHVNYPLKSLSDAMQLLKPGGYLILSTPNPVRPDIMLLSLFRRHYVNRGHVHAWDRSHWMNFLVNIAGLDVIEWPTDEVRILPGSLTRKVGILRSLQVGLTKLLPWWSFSNMAVICKPTRA